MAGQEQTGPLTGFSQERSNAPVRPTVNQRLRNKQGLNEVRGAFQALRPRVWFWTRLLAGILPEYSAAGIRAFLYRKAGCNIEKSVALLGRIRMIGNGKGHAPSRLYIASGSIIAPDVTFGLEGEIRIGHNVSISPGATLYTATHAVGFGSRRMNLAPVGKPIVVEDGVWIGMHCLVLPGVTLGHGCVVAAGSVVAQNVPANTLVAGNPATVQQALPFGNR